MKKIIKINCKSNYINSLEYDIQNKKTFKIFKKL